MKKIIENINWLIHDSGLQQKEISKESGVSSSTLSRLKQGQQPITEMKFKNIIKLEEVATRKKI